MLQLETVAALLLPTDFRAEPKIDCMLDLVLLPTIRREKAVPDTKPDQHLLLFDCGLLKFEPEC
jgi:hypothetical protein